MSTTKSLSQKTKELSFDDKKFCLDLLYLQYPDAKRFSYELKADMINKMILLENILTPIDIERIEDTSISEEIEDLKLQMKHLGYE